MARSASSYIYEGNLEDFWKFISKIRKDIKEPHKELYKRTLSDMFFTHMDKYYLLGEKALEESFNIDNTGLNSSICYHLFKRQPIEACRFEMEERYGCENSYLGAKIYFTPLNEYRILIIFDGHKDLRKWFESLDEIKYYNEVLFDSDYSLTCLEAVLMGGKSSISVGFTLNDIDDYSKSFNERIKEVVHSKLFKEKVDSFKGDLFDNTIVDTFMKISDEVNAYINENEETIINEYSKKIYEKAKDCIRNLLEK